MAPRGIWANLKGEYIPTLTVVGLEATQGHSPNYNNAPILAQLSTKGPAADHQAKGGKGTVS